LTLFLQTPAIESLNIVVTESVKIRKKYFIIQYVILHDIIIIFNSIEVDDTQTANIIRKSYEEQFLEK
jgi:hypothetical protein